MLAGSYLTRTKAGSGNRVKYILGYMLPGKQKGNDGEGLIIVQRCASADQCFYIGEGRWESEGKGPRWVNKEREREGNKK